MRNKTRISTHGTVNSRERNERHLKIQRSKLSHFADDMVLYIESPKDHQKATRNNKQLQ